MTTKDRPSDTTKLLSLGAITFVWIGLIVLFDHAARWYYQDALLVGSTTSGGRGLLILAVICSVLELYVIAFGLIVLISAVLVDISRPAQRRYSKFVNKTIGKLFPFRPAARLIRPSNTE